MEKITNVHRTVNKYWKLALAYLAEEGYVVIYDIQEDPHLPNDNIHVESVEKFVSLFLDLDSTKERYNKATEHMSKEAQEQGNNHYIDFINHYANDMCDVLVSYGLVTASSKNLLNCKLVKLNSNGLDAVLRLQEHEDSERRFNQQSEFASQQLSISESQIIIAEQQSIISSQLKKNSDKSVLIAVTALIMTALALYLSFQRVTLLEEKIVSHEVLDNRILELERKYHELTLNNEKLINVVSTMKKETLVESTNIDNITHTSIKSKVVLEPENLPKTHSVEKK